MTVQEIRSSATDEGLVRQARAGSSSAMDELWRRYQRRLFLFVRRRVATEQDAEDIVQEAFIKVMRYLDRFDECYRFCTWIYTICQQLVISHYRKQKLEQLPENMPLVDDGPIERAEAESLKDRLWQQAAASLSRKQFAVLWLRYVEGMSVQEVAKSLAISGINARVSLHRARLALAKSCSELSSQVMISASQVAARG